jgi:hypothetical protein
VGLMAMSSFIRFCNCNHDIQRPSGRHHLDLPAAALYIVKMD